MGAPPRFIASSTILISKIKKTIDCLNITKQIHLFHLEYLERCFIDTGNKCYILVSVHKDSKVFSHRLT
jgi:hypothetical protein